jgi:pimeloyl-ACP methyl ester carboxylesterase
LTPAHAEYGDRRNPAILFLHGIRLGRDIWVEHARALASRYHVVTLDLPGHGVLADVPFTQATIGELLDRTIATVCASPPLVVGYSLGGFVTMQYATRRLERTSGLVLAGCTLDFEGWKYWPYEVSSRLSECMPEPIFDALMRLGLYVSLPPSWAHLIGRIPFNREVIANTNKVAANTRFSEVLPVYKKPVMFVNGEFDMVFRLDERRFVQAMPDAQLRIIRGVDHSAPMRRVQEFTGIVGDFADRVFASPSPGHL